MVSKRIYAIDVLRGITVAAMIVVNNAGGKLSYAQLQHSEWSGMTLCDMVFPSFLFIVGLTAYISLGKNDFAWSWPTFRRILRRTVIILLIGWALHWIECMCKADFWPVAHLRLTGVLPRIALCYFFVSVIALTCRRGAIWVITIGLLAVYSAILWFGNGYSNDESNWLVVIDRWLLGADHLYLKQPVDPEGLVGTVSSVAHTLIGFMFGSLLINKKSLGVETGRRGHDVRGEDAPPSQSTPDSSLEARLLAIMAWGFLLYVAGLALDLAMPMNKRVWSPSFVLASCGLVAMALGAISYVTDVKGQKRQWGVFDVFGVNPLFLYVLSELTAIAISATKSKPVIYNAILAVIPDPYMASAVYSLLFVTAMWAVGYPLYKKKIYIKI